MYRLSMPGAFVKDLRGSFAIGSTIRGAFGTSRDRELGPQEGQLQVRAVSLLLNETIEAKVDWALYRVTRMAVITLC